MEHVKGRSPKAGQVTRLNTGRWFWPSPLDRYAWIFIVTAILFCWEWQARAGNVSSLFFPAPSSIFQTLLSQLQSGEIITHLSATLRRVMIGFSLGAGLGLLAGLCMGWSHRLRTVFDPLVSIAHPMPKIALLPLAMILFGIGDASKIVLVAVGAFFPVLINAMAGVRQIDRLYMEVGKNFGAGPGKVFTRILIPGSFPTVLAGMRVALNNALVVTIAIELVAAQEGLGTMIWLAWETLRTTELYAGLLVIAFLGICFNKLLGLIRKYCIPWQEEKTQP